MTLTFAVALAMSGTGTGGFYFVVPRQKKKKTEIPLFVGGGRISCTSFLSGENDDSFHAKSSPGWVKHQPGQSAGRSRLATK